MLCLLSSHYGEPLVRHLYPHAEALRGPWPQSVVATVPPQPPYTGLRGQDISCSFCHSKSVSTCGRIADSLSIRGQLRGQPEAPRPEALWSLGTEQPGPATHHRGPKTPGSPPVQTGQDLQPGQRSPVRGAASGHVLQLCASVSSSINRAQGTSPRRSEVECSCIKVLGTVCPVIPRRPLTECGGVAHRLGAHSREGVTATLPVPPPPHDVPNSAHSHSSGPEEH